MGHRELNTENPYVCTVPRELWEHTWLFSDPHFDHTNIIEYCSRPFRSTVEMNDTICRNWNERVRPSDLAFFLGDMAYGRGARPPKWWLKELNGRKIYLKGSHDQGIVPGKQLGDNVLHIDDSAMLVTEVNSYFLVHNPTPDNIPDWWDGWVVHGHKHNYQPHVLSSPFYRNRRVNVSADAINFAPITVKELIDRTTGGANV